LAIIYTWTHHITTGSIACSASLPVFSLLRGRFWGFSPRRGDTLHRWGEIWQGGGDRRNNMFTSRR